MSSLVIGLRSGFFLWLRLVEELLSLRAKQEFFSTRRVVQILLKMSKTALFLPQFRELFGPTVEFLVSLSNEVIPPPNLSIAKDPRSIG